MQNGAHTFHGFGQRLPVLQRSDDLLTARTRRTKVKAADRPSVHTQGSGDSTTHTACRSGDEDHSRAPVFASKR